MYSNRFANWLVGPWLDGALFALTSPQTAKLLPLRMKSKSIIKIAQAALLGATLPLIGQTVTSESDIVVLEQFEVSALKHFSDQAIPDITPVSFSELSKETIAAELGSRDIPLILNSTPSVFSTTDSGGAGDARVNVRGFNQRNVSILINGVPTNDIENGWLYWSNWDGLGDVTSTIQMQRGLSNVTLPTPSIGGTMNIITDPARARKGGSFKVEAGSDSFYKATAVLNTGMLQDKFALTLGFVKKYGDGYARGTWSDGWAYYVGATWKYNAKNRIEFFAIGAPQRHGQRTFASNIAAYDAEYARSLGYSASDITAALGRGPVDAGQNFNPNYAPVSKSYTGEQFYWGGTHARYDDNMLNERENYFHKPQVNVNWYSTISDTTRIDSVFYYSGGRGGGSGTLYNTSGIYGFQSSSRAFGFLPNTDSHYGSAYDWNKTIAANEGTRTVRNDRNKPAGQSLAILRNSVNEQDQYGIISKLSHEMTDGVKGTVGFDWRTAEIAHFREVRDLLGGDYYIPAAGQYSEFDSQGATRQLGLGDKVDYYNINTVDWLGLFAQVQYDKGPVHAFGVYGFSIIDYSYEDPFRKSDSNPSETFKLTPGSLDGNQIKGGVSYNISPRFSIYGNAGWVSRVPIFDGVIDDVTGNLVDPVNETFKSFETGLRFASEDRRFTFTANLYFTQWRDRTVSSIERDSNDLEYVLYLRGVDSDYNGLELEAAFQPNKWIRFDLAASFGDWSYTNDVTADAVYIGTGQPALDATKLYTEGLKVGDAPQSQIAYAVTAFPTTGLSVKFQGRWYDDYYADFAPESRTSSSDRGQPWQIPSYQVYDLHVNYRLPHVSEKFDVSLFAHVFNLFDETYVSDAQDNSSFEAITSAPSHSAQRAEVFLGPPTTYNLGARISF